MKPPYTTATPLLAAALMGVTSIGLAHRGFDKGIPQDLVGAAMLLIGVVVPLRLSMRRGRPDPPPSSAPR